MKTSPTRDFAIWVSPRVREEEDVIRPLVEGIIEVTLNWMVDVVFMPFEPWMAPPFPAEEPATTEDWHSISQARQFIFYASQYVITPYEPLAGQEVQYPSGLSMSDSQKGVVFYTSEEQYRTLSRDLDEFAETHFGMNHRERALSLEGRPVVDFLVDRLSTSQLVPDDVPHWLGLQRVVRN